MGEGEKQSVSLSNPSRRTAALVLFSVTLVWGATFIWMKQALNALDSELELYGTVPIVAFLVGARFFIAMLLMLLFFTNARSAIKEKELWRGGALLFA